MAGANCPFSHSEFPQAPLPKHCPFCGPGHSHVSLYEDPYGFPVVGCGACGAHSGFRSDKDPVKTVEAWNHRPLGE